MSSRGDPGLGLAETGDERHYSLTTGTQQSFLVRLIKSSWLARIVGLCVFGGLWQFASQFYPPFLLPSPIVTFSALIELVVEGDLLKQFIFSMQAMLLAFALALPTGIVLGLLMGGFPRAEEFIEPYLDALYVTPKVMLIPLFIIWFGIGMTSRVGYIFVISYFPIVVNTFVGVRQLRGDLTETARAFGATTWDMFLKIYMPGSIPMIMAGVRLAVGRAIVGMITAEMFLALVGLGYMVVDFGNRLATDKVLAMVIVVSAFGISATQFVKAIEKRIAPWSVTPNNRDI